MEPELGRVVKADGVQSEPNCGHIRQLRSQRSRREGIQERERTRRQGARDLRHTIAAGLDKAAELAFRIRRTTVTRQSGLTIDQVQRHEGATEYLNRGIDIDTATDPLLGRGSNTAVGIDE